MATLKVELGKPNRSGIMAVYILLTHRGTRKRIPTLITVTPNDISKRTGKIATPYLKDEIDDIIDVYRRKVNKLELDITGARLTADEIYERITRKKQIPDFFQFTEEWIDGKPTKKNYKQMLNNLERYLGKRQLPFEHITYSFLTHYSNYLSEWPRAQTHYLGLLRHIHNLARKTYNTEYETLISPTAIEQFDFPKQQLKGGRALDIDTIIRIYNFKPSFRRDEIARDAAMLSFFLMGINAVDLYNAKTYKYGYIIYNRTKTAGRRADGAHIEVKVDERIKPLVDKYRGTSRAFKFNELYASKDTFNANLAKGLKMILKEINAQIEKENIEREKRKEKKLELIPKLQFYQFRHSVATIMRNTLGIDKGTVNDVLCHVDDNMRITDVYIKKDFEPINEANKKLLDYFFEKLGSSSK